MGQRHKHRDQESDKNSMNTKQRGRQKRRETRKRLRLMEDKSPHPNHLEVDNLCSSTERLNEKEEREMKQTKFTITESVSVNLLKNII